MAAMRSSLIASMRDERVPSRSRRRSAPRAALLLAAAWVAGAAMLPGRAMAVYGSTPESDIDPSIFQIEEGHFLGARIATDFVFQDVDGNRFTLADLMGKPLILVLSYYTCDGACSVINRTLANTLKEMDRWELGRDYNVLTVSFDPHDTPATLRKFREMMGFAQLPQGWYMATMADRNEIDRLAKSIGFKFFWSPRDRVFLHPSVYTVLSYDGRISRYL